MAFLKLSLQKWLPKMFPIDFVASLFKFYSVNFTALQCTPYSLLRTRFAALPLCCSPALLRRAPTLLRRAPTLLRSRFAALPLCCAPALLLISRFAVLPLCCAPSLLDKIRLENLGVPTPSFFPDILDL
jgi:hypothetical protein